ncbi:MAG: ATP-binding cassette domain-containing protein [Kofleriaceae bacterium]
MPAPAVIERRNLLLPELVRWPVALDKPVIELDDVTLDFGDKRVLDGLSLSIPTGKTTVILGGSGSGKTVLLKLMIGLLRPTRGRVLVFGRDLATVSAVELLGLRKRMGMVFQSYALFDGLSVEDNVGFSLRENSHLHGPEIIALSHELIHLLQLDGSEAQLPGQLSGGMRKRVSLARALVANPEVVLYDEPTTGLDPLMVKRVDEMIELAKAQYGITSVVISHDMTSTQRIADTVRFLHDGQIAFAGTFEELGRSKLEPIQRFVAAAAVSARTTAPRPIRLDLGEPLIELVDVDKSFGRKHVLRGVNLAIYPRQTTSLIGASGSGKSVIVKHIMGMLVPDRGRVLAFGQDLASLSGRVMNEMRRHFGLVFQQAALLDWLSVRDNVAFPLVEGRSTPPAEVARRVDDALSLLKLTEIRDVMPGDLSLALRKRVGIARAIVTKPDVLIYDEPTTGQDPILTREIDDVIQEMQAQLEVASIVVSHDMASTFRISDRIAVLQDGAIVAFGTPADIRGSSNEYVQRFIRASEGELGVVDPGRSRDLETTHDLVVASNSSIGRSRYRSTKELQ